MDQQNQKMKYRLGLDLGTTSLGWAMLRLDESNQPCAVIRAGVRIFSDGRVPKTGESLAVQRRLARQQRRTRDRQIRRRNRLIKDLTELGFFPKDVEKRRTLVNLDPYALRTKGLDEALLPEEFARAIFHLAQRRGFKSNRKTDTRDNEASKMKAAIAETRAKLEQDNCRTVGEWLHKRHLQGLPTRCRLRVFEVQNGDKKRTDKIYDLYLDRHMIQDEFEQIWQAQTKFNSTLYNQEAHDRLYSTIFFQRDLRPVQPGRCTLLPEKSRAPLALPSQQRFRIYQEVNNLRKLDDRLNAIELTQSERDKIVDALEKNSKRSFIQIKKLINYEGDFNLEDERRTELKGNATSANLAKKDNLGAKWHNLPLDKQDEIVLQLLNNESEENLVIWLQENLDISESNAEKLANINLPSGYGSLSQEALKKILPVLEQDVITYDKAVIAAGFEHHSNLSHFAQTGEILLNLPYYGKYLQRHVGFGTGDPKDIDEKRYGKIANPTVHIGLNQVRIVVNALIKKYGLPSEIIIEVARELKLSREQKIEINQTQKENQKRRERIRKDIAEVLGCGEELVSGKDIEKWMLWEQLNPRDQMQRLCPYSGKQISASMLLGPEVEIEHILPYARTLDDSMNNKTVSLREANRVKGNRTPWEARLDFEAKGWSLQDMLARADLMPRSKRYRFGETGYQDWLKDNNDFVARALTDTQYLSRIAKEYLSLICPKTRSIPGSLTAMLRAKLGLNMILGDGKKNRNDHRHHAVDACVIAVTDQSLLQKVSTASAIARKEGAERIIKNMPDPWPNFYASVFRAIDAIQVSHRPDHAYQGAMHDQTAYGLLSGNQVITHKIVDKKKTAVIENLTVIKMTSEKATWRHGTNPDGSPKAYKGYQGNGNYCIEILKEENGNWSSDVITTYQAYQIAKQYGEARLRSQQSQSGKPLIMRLMINDTIRLTQNGETQIYLVNALSINGVLTLSPINEANVSNRNRDENDSFLYTRKIANALKKANAKFVTVSPIGNVTIHK